MLLLGDNRPKPQVMLTEACSKQNFDFQLHLEPKSCPPPTHKGTRHDLNLNTGNKGSTVQEDLVLMTLYYKWPSSKLLTTKICSTSTSAYLFPLTVYKKQKNLMQPSRWISGTIRSHVSSAGSFLINKLFLTPNSDILSIGLFWHTKFGFSNIIRLSP